MKIKLTEVKLHQNRTAFGNSSSVLRAIKMKTLKPQELEAMKALESAVQNLESVLITCK